MTTITADTATMAPGQLNRYRGAFRSSGTARRRIGRCRCGAGVRVEGEPLLDAKGDAAVIGDDGLLYTTRVLNTHEVVLVQHRCDAGASGRRGDDWKPWRWVFARPVVDGGKPDSKRHMCGSSRTASATCAGRDAPAPPGRTAIAAVVAPTTVRACEIGSV